MKDILETNKVTTNTWQFMKKTFVFENFLKTNLVLKILEFDVKGF